MYSLLLSDDDSRGDTPPPLHFPPLPSSIASHSERGRQFQRVLRVNKQNLTLLQQTLILSGQFSDQRRARERERHDRLSLKSLHWMRIVNWDTKREREKMVRR